jgi:hypothetical protein
MDVGSLTLPEMIAIPIGLGGVIMLMRSMWIFQGLVIQRLEARAKNLGEQVDRLELDLKARDVELREMRETHYLHMTQLRDDYQACRGEQRALRTRLQEAGITWDPTAWNEPNGI